MLADSQAGEDSKNLELRKRLVELIAEDKRPNLPPIQEQFVPADVIITHNEVNDNHGVGVLTAKIFANEGNIISIRSQNHFGGEQQFGDMNVLISHHDRRRRNVFQRVIEALKDREVRRIVCMPFYADDVLTAIAVKEIFGVPMCTYIMDDQNIYSDGIPDHLMRELLVKSALRLAISAELRREYEKKYGYKFWLLPPVVSSELISANPRLPNGVTANRGIIVGNIWGRRWLELLRRTVKGSGIELDWYCNSDFLWHSFDRNELAEEGIQTHRGLPERELVPLLRKHYFVVLPSGTLDAADDRRAIAQLSLPSKVPFILAASNTPIIVLGNRETAAARFVVGSQIGAAVDYETQSFRQAVEFVTTPEVQRSMRQNASAIARAFSAHGIAEWLWLSLEQGHPCDQRFETLAPFQEKQN